MSKILMRHDEDNTWGHVLYAKNIGLTENAEINTIIGLFEVYHDEKCTVPVKSEEMESLFFQNIAIYTDLTGDPNTAMFLKPSSFSRNGVFGDVTVPYMNHETMSNGIGISLNYYAANRTTDEASVEPTGE